jgi:hypothetical protein
LSALTFPRPMTFGEFSPFPNSFANAIAQPPLAGGYPLQQGMSGIANISGLVGINDPGTKMIIDMVMGGVLQSMVGNNFVPANFTPGVNMHNQMRAREALGGFRKSVGEASKADSRTIYEMIRGTARMTGSEFGPRQQEAARSFASSASGFLPFIAATNPDLVDRLGGATGSATVMAQNMYMGGRFATDPVTGRRGMTSDSVSAITTKVFENLYGPGKDLSQMGGLRAGEAGALYDDMQRRGLMGGARPRSESLQKIAKDMNVTIAEATALPDIDSKIREVDADRISGKLKEMSKAVSAMKEIFGEMGQPDAPMQELVGAIESLTQANIPSMEPAKLERMIRNTSNTAKAVGIDMPTTFKLMGATAAMTDRAGVDRIFAPEITMQAMRENEASKRIFGGAKAFGLASHDKLMNVQQQLGVDSVKDFRTQQLGAIARLVDQYKFQPKQGSELSKVYDVITGKKPATEADTKMIMGIHMRPGGMAAFLKDQGVSGAVIQDLAANQSANAEFINKYDIGNKIGRNLQAERAVVEMTGFGRNVVGRYAKDAGDASAGLKKEMEENSGKLSEISARALMNASKEELNNPEDVVKKSLEAHFKSKGLVLSDKDKQLVNSMSAGLADNAKSYANRAGFQYLSNMQATLSPRILKEAAVTGAQVEQESQFQETLRGVAKTDVTQRLVDFLKTAGPNTEFKEGAAAILGFQNKNEMMGLLGPEIEAMGEASRIFSSFDARKVKEAYIRNAAVENKLDSEQQNLTDDQKKKNQANKENIKTQIVQSGLAKDMDDAEKKFSEFADYSKYKEEYKGVGTKEEARARSKEILQDFQKKHGVTAQQARDLDPNDLTTAGRANALDMLRKAASSSGFEVLDKFGRTVQGGSRFKELNEAYNQLTSTESQDTQYGIEALRRFTDIYGSSKQMIETGGVEGARAMSQARGITDVLYNLAGATGSSITDLMSGKTPETMVDVEHLKSVKKGDISLIDDLLNEKDTIDVNVPDPNDPKKTISVKKSRAQVARENVENVAIKGLEEEIKIKPELKARNEQRISELKSISGMSKEQLKTKREGTEKTLKELESGVVDSAVKDFTDSLATQKKADTQLDSLIKNISKTTGVTDIAKDINMFTQEHKLTADERAETKRLLKSEKSIKSTAGSEYDQLQDLNKSFTKLSEAESKELSGIKGDRSKQARAQELINKSGASSAEDYELKSKQFDEGIKKISDISKQSEADVRKTFELTKKAGQTSLDAANRHEDFVSTQEKRIGADNAKKLIDAKKEADKAAVGVSGSIEALSKYDPTNLLSKMGAGGFKQLIEASKKSMIDLTGKLSGALTSPSGAKLSDEEKERLFIRNNAGGIGTAYLRNIGVDQSKFTQGDQPALMKVASDINAAANQAAKIGKLDSKASDDDKLKQLRTILAKEDSKLTAEEKTLKQGLEKEGITNKLFTEGGGFSATGLKGLVSEAQKGMPKAASLTGKPGDPSQPGQPKEIVAVLPKNTKFEITGKLAFSGKVDGSMTADVPNKATT